MCAVTVLVTHAYTLVTAELWRGLTRSRLVARSRLEFLRRVGIGGGAKAGADTAERMLLDIILKERVVRCRPQKPKFFGGAGEVAWLASEWIDGPPAFETVGLWGERSVRGVLVGAGPLLVTQRLTGGSPRNDADTRTSHADRWMCHYALSVGSIVKQAVGYILTS